MKNRTELPTWADAFALRKPDAEALAAELIARGYLAQAEATGTCSTVDGEHVHLCTVRVFLTPAQARRLARS